MSLTQRRRVIHPVAGYGDDIAGRLQRLHQAPLLRHPLQNLFQLSQLLAITGPVALALQTGRLLIDAYASLVSVELVNTSTTSPHGRP
ncbi:MAG: hypothetical protein WA140_08580 [Geobacteraceae bacterium]